MAYDEVAEATGHSVATVKRDWRRAHAWLYHAMRDEPAADDPADSETANEQ